MSEVAPKLVLTVDRLERRFQRESLGFSEHLREGDLSFSHSTGGRRCTNARGGQHDAAKKTELSTKDRVIRKHLRSRSSDSTLASNTRHVSAVPYRANHHSTNVAFTLIGDIANGKEVDCIDRIPAQP